MKLSQWAKERGLHYQTAWRLFKKGQIPDAYALPSGTVLVEKREDVTSKPEHVVVYTRVSSSENRKYLDSQVQRIADFCSAKGWIVAQSIKEVGSGLNDQRPQLVKILEKGLATKIVVEHRDRLTRFGFNFIKILCDRIGCEIVVINEAVDDKKELIDDFISIITSFCARIYGLRRGKRKKIQIKEVLENEEDNDDDQSLPT